MLKQLIIENLVLVDNVDISFSTGLNIITGETGSGKSALIEALSLCLGKRADASFVRKDEEQALVEAHFEIEGSAPIWKILNEAGIAATPDELLVIRRQIHKEGKNKAYINCRLATLPVLQEIGSYLIEIVNQSAHHSLRSAEEQLDVLDLFAGHHNLLEEVKNCFESHILFHKELKQLKELQTVKLREEDLLRFQLKEIEEADLKEGLEDSFLEEYKTLQNAEEIQQKAGFSLSLLSESPTSITHSLHKVKNYLQALQKKSAQFGEVITLIEEAQIAINEAIHTLNIKTADISPNPKKLEQLEKKLASINSVLKKYGPSIQDVFNFKDEIIKKMQRFQTLEDLIIEKEAESNKAYLKLIEKVENLTASRKKAAMAFSLTLTNFLKLLNMPSALLKIEFNVSSLNSKGSDEVSFLLQANKGESFASVKDHISGGELCRLLFAIKAILAKKNLCPTLIFDEIDANVGGTTATIMGEKLLELSQERQVLCITHFAQVAKFGNVHLAVSKLETSKRTLTRIEKLDNLSVEKEILRMMGNALKIK